ncbi:MAG: UbiA family prenyltransferase [Luteolibacter sp.]
MTSSGKLHALLSTARIANVPSVVSNVWVGVAIGIAINMPRGDGPLDPIIPWPHVLLLIAAGICLYVAGNFTNDWMDRIWDSANRPERALPRGLFKPREYLSAALSLGLLGVILATLANEFAGVVALLIVAFIVIYTIWHKRGSWTVVPMGLCRGLLPMMGALGMMGRKSDSQADLVFTVMAAAIAGGALFCYIVGLSMSARRESMSASSPKPEISGDLFFVITGLAALVPIKLAKQATLPFLLAPIPYMIWLILCRTAFRKPIPKFVSALLAGIPLVDWMLLIPFCLWDWDLGTGMTRIPSHPLGWVSLVLPPLAFILALLLQRLAPAT